MNICKLCIIYNVNALWRQGLIFYWVPDETNLNGTPYTLSLCIVLGLMEIGKNKELKFNSQLKNGAGQDWVRFQSKCMTVIHSIRVGLLTSLFYRATPLLSVGLSTVLFFLWALITTWCIIQQNRSSMSFVSCWISSPGTVNDSINVCWMKKRMNYSVEGHIVILWLYFV